MTIKRKSLLCLLIAGTCLILSSSKPAISAEDNDIIIVSNKKSEYKIVLPEKSGNQNFDYFMQEMAKLLRYCMKTSTGTDLPIISESETVEGPPGIFIGATKVTLADGIDTKKFKGWEYQIKVSGNNIFLAGLDHPGTRNIKNFSFHQLATAKAVTTFLEKYLGVMFLLPGRDGLFIPEKNSISIPATTDIHIKPKIEFCTSRNKEFFYDIANNFFPSSTIYGSHGGHSHLIAIPPEKYFKTHPEYFIMKKGKRILKKSFPHLCISNPEVQELIYQELIKHSNEGYDVVQLGQNDGFTPCACEECHKLFGIYPTTKPGTRESYQDPAWGEKLWIIHRKMAERFMKDRPGKKIAIMAYGPTKNPPTTFNEFPENTIIEIARGNEERFEKWKTIKVPGGFYVYLYNWSPYGTEGLSPKQTPEFIVKQARRFHKNNVKGIYRCGFGESFGLEGPVYYLFGKILDDPDLKQDNILGNYYLEAYGSSAKDMHDFFDLLHSRLKPEDKTDIDWNNIEFVLNRYPSAGQLMQLMLKRYPEGIIGQLEKCLSEAEKKSAENTPEAKRLHVTRIEFDYLKNIAETYNAFAKYIKQPTKESFDQISKLVKRHKEYVNSLLPENSTDETRIGKYGTINLLGSSTKSSLLHGSRSTCELAEPFTWDFDYLQGLAINPGNREITASRSDNDSKINTEIPSQIMLAPDLLENHTITQDKPTYIQCCYDENVLKVNFICKHSSRKDIETDSFVITIAADNNIHNQMQFRFTVKSTEANLFNLAIESCKNNGKGDIYLSYTSNIKASIKTSAIDKNNSTSIEVSIPFSLFGLYNPPCGDSWKINFERISSDKKTKYVWQPDIINNPRKRGIDALGKIAFMEELETSEKTPNENKTETINLIKNGGFETPPSTSGEIPEWQTIKHIHQQMGKDIEQEIQSGMSSYLINVPSDSENHILTIKNSPTNPILQEKLRKITTSNRIMQSINIPEADGKTIYNMKWKVSRKADTKIPYINMIVFVNFTGDYPKDKYANHQRYIRISENAEEYLQYIVPPEKTTGITVIFALYGQGEVYIDDIIFKAAQQNK